MSHFLSCCHPRGTGEQGHVRYWAEVEQKLFLHLSLGKFCQTGALRSAVNLWFLLWILLYVYLCPVSNSIRSWPCLMRSDCPVRSDPSLWGPILSYDSVSVPWRVRLGHSPWFQKVQLAQGSWGATPQENPEIKRIRESVASWTMPSVPLSWMKTTTLRYFGRRFCSFWARPEALFLLWVVESWFLPHLGVSQMDRDHAQLIHPQLSSPGPWASWCPDPVHPLVPSSQLHDPESLCCWGASLGNWGPLWGWMVLSTPGGPC